MRQAKDAGKLARGYEIPGPFRDNYPERIARALKPAREAGLLPPFPFGSDFTEVEQRLIPALQVLQEAQRTPLQLAGLLWRGLIRRPDVSDRECLARLGLDQPVNWCERAYPRVGQRSAGGGQGRLMQRSLPWVHLFLLTGLRFSMNAAMPSVRSSSAKVE